MQTMSFLAPEAMSMAPPMPPEPLAPGTFPVGEVAFFRDLKAAEYRDVEMAAAGHKVGVSLMNNGCAGNQSDRYFHSVDEVVVFLAGTRATAHAEDAVLAMEIHDDIGRKMVGDESGKAEAEIDAGTVGKLARGALGDLFASEARLFGERKCVRHSGCLWPARYDARR
jgi:hypothetical protein